jgi:ADP-ribosyl-[dinitrogen reductase] hydrolase
LVIFISDHVRAKGSLIGLAIGDAFGAPLEGSPAPRESITEMLPGGRLPRRKGEVTDDTLQALAVAQSLIACRRFDPGDTMARFADMYRRSPQWFGPTSSVVFDLVLAGTPVADAARVAHEKTGSSRSNGSVMRGFPIGVFFAPPTVYDVSIACSQLTHFDPVAAHSSAFLNLMVSHMCRAVPRDEAYHHACSACRDAEVLSLLGSYAEQPPDPSLDSLLCAHAALTCFMQAGSFEEALITAVNLGGDADTVGACTGALAGSYWGVGAIPERWIRDLENFPHIAEVAEDLALTAEQ